MNIFLVAIILVAVAGLLLALKSKQGTRSADGLSFDKKDPLFSPAERSFLGVLEQVLGSKYRVFGKVRLGDIIKPAKGLGASKHRTASNKIQLKHVDFVICSAADISLVAAVELDDKSHEREDRMERDSFVDQALSMAQIPVVHFPAKKGYALPEVRAQLAAVLPDLEKAASIAESETKAIPPAQPAPPVQQKPAVQPEAIAPVCTKCGATMVKRQAQKGEHAGKWFWACSAFPKCRQVVPIR